MKLTAAETKWLADVQKVLDAAPSKRLGFYTFGDSEVHVYDLSKEKKIDELMEKRNIDFPVAVNELKAECGEIRFPANVHSVAG